MKAKDRYEVMMDEQDRHIDPDGGETIIYGTGPITIENWNDAVWMIGLQSSCKAWSVTVAMNSGDNMNITTEELKALGYDPPESRVQEPTPTETPKTACACGGSCSCDPTKCTNCSCKG